MLGPPLTVHGGAGLVHQPVALQDAVGELRGLPGHIHRGCGQLAELDRAGSTGGCRCGGKTAQGFRFLLPWICKALRRSREPAGVGGSGPRKTRRAGAPSRRGCQGHWTAFPPPVSLTLTFQHPSQVFFSLKLENSFPPAEGPPALAKSPGQACVPPQGVCRARPCPSFVGLLFQLPRGGGGDRGCLGLRASVGTEQEGARAAMSLVPRAQGSSPRDHTVKKQPEPGTVRPSGRDAFLD